MNRRLILTAGLVVGLIIIGAFALYLALPLVLDQRAGDLPPATAAASEPAASPTEIAQQPTTETTATSTSEEPQPTATQTTAPATATPLPTSEPQTPTAEGPVVIASAEFVNIDNSYQGSGTVTIHQQADGQRVLRFEEFMVSSGPQLHVLMATNSMPTSQDELGEYVDLGPLKDTSGAQEYQIPADVELENYQSVVIYCVPFHVVFTVATFGP